MFFSRYVLISTTLIVLATLAVYDSQSKKIIRFGAVLLEFRSGFLVVHYLMLYGRLLLKRTNK
jgi:hypothetical protein